ncbi:ATP-binding protein [Candidatus Daviesbacteria bacterium]|nr:ATP-binding protein [Candidatus Daviesbacteria bacterium]
MANIARAETSGMMTEQNGLIDLIPARLILVTGVGGVGKSTLVNGLVQSFNAAIVDKDAVADVFTTSRNGDYEQQSRQMVYKIIFDKTEQGLRCYRTVIVNASFKSEISTLGWEMSYRQLAAQYGAKLKIIRLTTNPSVLRQRLIDRNCPYDKHKSLGSDEEFAAWHQTHEPIEVEMPKGSLVVDNSDGNFVGTLHQALSYILG